jgi:hypothetical protein
MIEVADNPEKKRLYLVVNGIQYDDDDYSTTVLPVPLSGSEDGVGLILRPKSSEMLELLLQHSYSEFPQVPWTFHLPLHQQQGRDLGLIESDKDISHDITVYRTSKSHLYLGFNILFETENWKRLWSISEYKIAFKRIIDQQNILGELPSAERIATLPRKYVDPPTHTFLLRVTDPNATIREVIRSQSDLMENLHELTRSSLLSQLQNESVVVRFEFPEEAKIACEQYLLYFVQFLQDVGVEATAELQHDAGQVLFAVTPKDKDDALEKIRNALHLYLNIPLSIIDGSETNIATQRLASNVYHLRSQLALITSAASGQRCDHSSTTSDNELSTTSIDELDCD